MDFFTVPKYLERLGRYIVRVPMPSKDVRLTSEGQVRVATPPDPRSGKTELVLDPLDWIHAVTQQIPAPRQHMARYYGAYSKHSGVRPRSDRSHELMGNPQEIVEFCVLWLGHRALAEADQPTSR